MIDKNISGLSSQLSTDMTLLKLYLQSRKSNGFTEAAKVIEIMSRELFRAAGLASFTDANFIKGNQPAIDLFEKKPGKKGIAAQVTSTANLTKIKKTIAKFELEDKNMNSLSDEYEKLYIFGLLSAKTDWIDCPDYCKVLSSDDLLQIITNRGDYQAMHDAIDTIRSHQERSILLTPYLDRDCLDVVLDTVNRSAIKHHMNCEGSVSDMLKGLTEIAEVIGKGSIKGKSIAKGISEYSDKNIIEFLRKIQDWVSEISAVVNVNSYRNSYNLNQNENERIDVIKNSIVDASNKIAIDNGLSIRIKMVRI